MPKAKKTKSASDKKPNKSTRTALAAPMQRNVPARSGRIYRAVDARVEGYYEFHIYEKNGVSLYDRAVMTRRCIELILSVGGEIREDHSDGVGLVLYSLPYGVRNPVRMDNPMFRGKMITSFWPKYTEAELKIFFGEV